MNKGPIAFDITGLDQNRLGGGLPVNLTGFVPSVTMAITAGTHIVFTDASTFPAGDAFDNINITVGDEHGNEVKGSITAATGTVTLPTDPATLVAGDVLTVKATVTSTKGAIADGLIKVTTGMTTVAVANWAISFTTSI